MACSTVSWSPSMLKATLTSRWCERMLMRRRHITVVYVIFDVLSLDGRGLDGSWRSASTAATAQGNGAGRRSRTGNYWPYELERESAVNRPRQRMFVLPQLSTGGPKRDVSTIVSPEGLPPSRT